MSDPNFQKKFEEAIAEWRKRYGVRDGDVLLMCMDLFRIHQEHWDAIRRRDFPSLQEFNSIALRLEKAAIQTQKQTEALLKVLQRTRKGQEFLPPTITAVVLILALAFACGLLTGKFLL
jgi:hypothetical protein